MPIMAPVPKTSGKPAAKRQRHAASRVPGLKSLDRPGWQHRAVSVCPIILVNGVAFGGQLGWAHDHLQSWHIAGQIVFALALESVAIFLAYNAFLAEKVNDTALRLKLASYAYGLLVGLLNYSHYARNSMTEAIAVGLMSASSPWLWAIYSRRASRNTLLTQRLIEPHAVRLGATRWFYYPIKTFRVARYAAWHGQTVPATAITDYETGKVAMPVNLNGHKQGLPVRQEPWNVSH